MATSNSISGFTGRLHELKVPVYLNKNVRYKLITIRPMIKKSHHISQCHRKDNSSFTVVTLKSKLEPAHAPLRLALADDFVLVLKPMFFADFLKMTIS